MSHGRSSTCLDEKPVPMSSESPGCVGTDEVHDSRSKRNGRPLSMAWISDELLAETIDVWSGAYGRPISEDEAVEILMNVKRLGEVLLKARREGIGL